MPADRRHQLTRSPPLLRAAARSQMVWASIGLTLVLTVPLALPLGRTMAANAPATVLQPVQPVQPLKPLKPIQPVLPAASGKAKTTRQALLKQRTTVLNPTVRHAGKIVSGSTAPPPKTIVTRRILPK
ncbi:MAG: hypothetical protein ABSF31_02250 [Steroidobacteraceae bacterium]|jgi:hypothetical protein